MAIRFQCGSCDQPIEVDEQWASRTVACPYCRNTITAPAESTITDLTEIPVATPLRTEGVSGMMQGNGPHPPGYSAVHPNRIALVALGLAGTMLLLMIFAAAVASSHRLEIESLQDRALELQKEGANPLAATQRASAEFYNDYGGLPPSWLIGLFVLYLCIGLTWIATLVCALVGIRRQNRRSMAVTALVVAGAMPILFCCGVFLLAPAGG